MEKRRLLVLANSIKRSARCVAGRVVILRGGEYSLGAWIRPISGHGQGELGPDETMCVDGSQVKVMDFAEVGLKEDVHNRYQPENWMIAGPRVWMRLDGEYMTPTAEALVESPRNLWIDRGEERTDRVIHARLVLKPPEQSLYVIRPKNLRLKFYAEFSEEKGHAVARRRALFSYNGEDYDFALTDPVATDKYGPRVPALGEAARMVAVKGDPLACVSLTADFNGFHYKILATVIEM